MPSFHRLTVHTLSLVLFIGVTTLARAADDTALSADQASIGAIANHLDGFHQAAAQANFELYFSHFTNTGVFIGTDASEYWPVEQFKAYTKPLFDKGQGWVYHPISRDITLGPDGKTAWFHELLQSENYGTSRGTGALIWNSKKGWLIDQYHLTFPMPNDLVDEFTSTIKNYQESHIQP